MSYCIISVGPETRKACRRDRHYTLAIRRSDVGEVPSGHPGVIFHRPVEAVEAGMDKSGDHRANLIY